MGVIQRQGLKSAIVTYFFMAFGMVSNLLIYTKMLEVSELGTISFVLTTAITFSPFLILGFQVMYLKFFARYQNDSKSISRLYSLTFYGPLILSALVSAAYFIFRDSIIQYYVSERNVDALAIDLAYILTITLPFTSVLIYVCSTLQRTAIPTLLTNLLKVVQPMLVILYYYDWVTFHQLLISITIFHILLLAAFYIYQQSIQKIAFSLNVKDTLKLPKTKKMLSYALYAFSIGVGSLLITNIDTFMVGTLIGMEQLGLYSWGLTLINAVVIPFTLLAGIATPFVSRYWEERNMPELNKLYKQSANMLLLICSALFFAVWLGIDDLFALIPKGDQYQSAKIIILMLGLAKVIDVSTGFNDTIIAFSTKHRAYFWIIGSAAILNIVLNYILIPLYGIEGAATATLISFIIFNFMKYFFIKKFFKLSPFNIQYAYIFVTCCSLFGLFYILPNISNHLVNMAYKCIGYLSVYAVIMYRFNFSKEYNEMIDKLLARLPFK